MLKPNFVVATATFLAISVIATPPAFARGGGGGMGHAAWQGSNPPGFSHGVKKGWNGASVPPGWSKGKKMGWNGRGVPPGLYGR
jgi:hypothetical protein